MADSAQEARRQSLLVSGRESERESLEFIESAADGKGWRWIAEPSMPVGAR